jgi:hypothetical protein
MSTGGDPGFYHNIEERILSAQQRAQAEQMWTIGAGGGVLGANTTTTGPWNTTTVTFPAAGAGTVAPDWAGLPDVGTAAPDWAGLPDVGTLQQHQAAHSAMRAVMDKAALKEALREVLHEMCKEDCDFMGWLRLKYAPIPKGETR